MSEKTLKEITTNLAKVVDKLVERVMEQEVRVVKLEKQVKVLETGGTKR